MEAVVIETLHLPDRARTHAKVTSFPATIGRGYDNAVVLYDEEVSTVHARLERNDAGVLLLVDAGSTNGLLVGEDDQRVTSVPVTHGLVVRLGHTELTFKQAGRPAEKTVVSRRVTRADPVASKRLAAAALLVLLGLLAFYDYRGSVDEQDLGDLVAAMFSVVVAVLGYAALWSVIGRLVTHSWRYLSHLTLALLTVAGLSFVNGFVPHLVEYALDAPRALPFVVTPLTMAVTWGALQAHLRRAANWTEGRARVTAAVLVVSVVSVFVGRSVLSRQSFTSSLPISATASPPRFLFASPRPVDALLDDLDALQAPVDAEAAREE